MRESDLLPLTPPISRPAATQALFLLGELDAFLDGEDPLQAARHVIGTTMNVRELSQLSEDQNRFNRGLPKSSLKDIERINEFLDIASQIVLSEGISFSE
ncbi:MAG: hypothetical protein ABII80_03340 [bacterium]